MTMSKKISNASVGVGVFLVLLLLVPTAAKTKPPDLSLKITEVGSPAAVGSGQPNLSVAPDGRILLSWVEDSRNDGQVLLFSTWQRGAWSKPQAVAKGRNWFVNWADFPSLIALPDGSLAAHWLARSSAGKYSYDVHIARSFDAGRTWTPSIVPHRDGTPTEHGFVSLLPWEEEDLLAVWLDGREMAAAKPDQGEHAGHGRMTLRYVVLGPHGTFKQGGLLDDRVCDCCQTSAALTPPGVLLAYRDRTEGEIRDISVIRFENQKWSRPQVLHRDGWEINGCPVNGPVISAEGRRVAIAWFTEAKETARVLVSLSQDGGKAFGEPVQVDEGNPLGRVDVVMLASGAALVSWLEATDEGAEIRLRRVFPGGARDPSILAAGSSAARASGFPRMERSGEELVLAWTDADETTQVRTANARLPASY